MNAKLNYRKDVLVFLFVFKFINTALYRLFKTVLKYQNFDSLSRSCLWILYRYK